MKTKFKTRILSIFLLAAVLLPQSIQSAWVANALATTLPVTVATDYFFKQLESSNERIFYAAMQNMLETGQFKQGNVSVEVSGLEMPEGGNNALLKQMGAARDAFMFDYPDLFYVDFDALSLRIEDGKVYLGTGRGKHYINGEFINDDGNIMTSEIDAAIAAVNSRLNTIVDKAKSQAPHDLKEQIKIAHDEVISSAAYKFEYQAKHPYSVRTVYGVFGLSQDEAGAMCEGYARALKAVLDRLGIPTILVHGYYLESGKRQEHMWNYVQLDGTWYAVDPTFDNTSNEADRHNYFMVDGSVMRNHFTVGLISTSDKEFFYPELDGGVSEDTTEYSEEFLGNVVYRDASGIVIVYAGAEEINDHGKIDKVYHISYQGKGYKEAAKDGNYIITNAWQLKDNAGTDETDMIPTSWLYATDVNIDYEQIYEDHGNYFSVRMDNVTAFQVGVTKVGFTGEPNESNYYGVFFEGTLSDIFAMSTEIKTGVGKVDYPAPFVKKTTPAHTTAQVVGKTYHVTVEYDQELVPKSEGAELGYDLVYYDLVYGYRQPDQERDQFRIENLRLSDDGKTISYDFTPSKLWALDDTLYMINFTGVKGKESGKAPNPVEYLLYNRTTTCIFQLRDLNTDLETYGKPILMDDFELSGIVDPAELGVDAEFMQKYGDLLKSRVSLVTTTTTEAEDAMLSDMIDSKADGREKLKVETYNISLNLCEMQLKAIKEGQRIRIKLGFPEGYGPNDAGVTFRAYHYALQDDGSYEIEEINCTVTELGLIIEVTSFSPFAIAALSTLDGEADVTQNKIVTIQATAGGQIFDENGNLVTEFAEVVDGEPHSFTAKANAGYKIDTLTINGEEIAEAKGQTEYTFTATARSKVFVAFIADNTGETSDTPFVPGDSNSDTTPPQPEAPNTGLNTLTSLISSKAFLIPAAFVASALAALLLRRKKTA